MPADSEPSPKNYLLKDLRFGWSLIMEDSGASFSGVSKTTCVINTEIMCLFRFDQFEILCDGKIWIVNNQLKFSWFVENIFEWNHMVILCSDRKWSLWIRSKAFSNERKSIVATRRRWDRHYSWFCSKWSGFITDIECCLRSNLTSRLWYRKWSLWIPLCWVNLDNEFSFMLWIWHKLNW